MMERRPEQHLEVRALTSDGSVIEVIVNGRLLREENKELIVQLEAAIERHGSIRLLIRLEDFRGVDIRAVIEGLKSDCRHLGKFERIAVVGDRLWEEWITRIGALVVTVETRYFDVHSLPEAEAWILGGGAPGADPLLDMPAFSP